MYSTWPIRSDMPYLMNEVECAMSTFQFATYYMGTTISQKCERGATWGDCYPHHLYVIVCCFETVKKLVIKCRCLCLRNRFARVWRGPFAHPVVYAISSQNAVFPVRSLEFGVPWGSVNRCFGVSSSAPAEVRTGSGRSFDVPVFYNTIGVHCIV